MRNAKVQVLAILVILITVSCRVAEIYTVNREDQLSEKLPPLFVEIDYLSFESALGITENYYTAADCNDCPEPYPVINEKNQRLLQNMVSVAQDYISENITESYGDRQGAIICRIKQSNYDNNLDFLAFPSAFTLGVLNLLGMPLSKYRSNMEVELAIYDEDSNLVGNYRGIGKGKAYVALYYGYTYDSAKELAFRKSFVEAIDKAKAQIEEDHVRLMKEFKS